jgi:hypothetical protein
MSEQKQVNKKPKELPSSIRKLAKYYQASRDEWKGRNAKKAVKIQILMTDVSRLKNRLNKEKEKVEAEENEKEKKLMNQEIENLKKKLNQY